MEENMEMSEKEQAEALEKLYAFVIEQVKAGVDKSTISQKLVDLGVEKTEAYQLVEAMHSEIVKAVEAEQFTISSIMPAVIGGVLAAVLGGFIWGMIVINTGYEIGIAAWGMGGLAGYAVVLFSKGRKGFPLQIVAILSSVLGIVIGKYALFFHYLKEAVAKEQGSEVASTISAFSEGTIQFFFENIGLTVSGFDILWVILAVLTAWRIPKGSGIKLPQ